MRTYVFMYMRVCLCVCVYIYIYIYIYIYKRVCFCGLVFENYAGSSTMKDNDMGWECSTCEEEENGMQGFGVSVRKEETVRKTR